MNSQKHSLSSFVKIIYRRISQFSTIPSEHNLRPVNTVELDAGAVLISHF